MSRIFAFGVKRLGLAGLARAPGSVCSGVGVVKSLWYEGKFLDSPKD